MKRHAILTMSIGILTAVLVLGAMSSAELYGQQEPLFVPGRVIIRFADSILPVEVTRDEHGQVGIGVSSIDQILSQEECESLEVLYKSPGRQWPTIFLAIFPEEASVPDIVDDLSHDNYVEYAEADYIYETCSTPDDSLFPDQWALDSLHMKLEAAWDDERGDSTVIIQSNDTGVAWDTHEDLVNKIWVNPDEDINESGYFEMAAPPNGDLNNQDDDGNDLVDDVIGWDWYFNDYDPSHTSADNANRGHGTQMAGTFAAETNNRVGIAGVCPECRIMPAKVGNGTGINVSDAIKAIEYAISKGVSAINMSWGGQFLTITERRS